MNRTVTNSGLPGGRKAARAVPSSKSVFTPGDFFVPALALPHGLTVSWPQASVNDGRDRRDNQRMSGRMLAGWRTSGPGPETSTDSKHYSGGSCNTLEKP